MKLSIKDWKLWGIAILILIAAILIIFGDRVYPEQIEAERMVFHEPHVQQLDCDAIAINAIYDQTGFNWDTEVTITCYDMNLTETHNVFAVVDVGQNGTNEIVHLEIDDITIIDSQLPTVKTVGL